MNIDNIALSGKKKLGNCDSYQFIACQLQSHLELDPVNKSPLPAGTMVDLISRGHWRNTASHS